MACYGVTSNVFVATQKFIQEKLLLCIDSVNVTATFTISQVRFTFILLCLDWNIYWKYQYKTIKASISDLSGHQIHFVLKSHVLTWDIQCSLCWWHAISDPRLFVRYFFFFYNLDCTVYQEARLCLTLLVAPQEQRVGIAQDQWTLPIYLLAICN